MISKVVVDGGTQYVDTCEWCGRESLPFRTKKVAEALGEKHRRVQCKAKPLVNWSGKALNR